MTNKGLQGRGGYSSQSWETNVKLRIARQRGHSSPAHKKGNKKGDKRKQKGAGLCCVMETFWVVPVNGRREPRQVATALEGLALKKSSQGWARHLKEPDVFKPDGRDAGLKLWGVLNYVKGLDPSMAAGNVDANYNFEDMTDETKAKAVRLYSLLTSYLRQRPLKLIRHVKSENGFEAWQTLLKEMQPATRARAREDGDTAGRSVIGSLRPDNTT